MSSEENKAVVRRWFEALELGTALQVVEQFYAPDYVLHNPGAPPDLPPGPPGVIRFLSLMHTAFPDLRARLEDVLAEGDRVAVRFSMRGTQPGEFTTGAPAGRLVTFAGASLIRFSEGKIVEAWEYVNVLPDPG
jgi:predicted ester cyclase